MSQPPSVAGVTAGTFAAGNDSRIASFTTPQMVAATAGSGSDDTATFQALQAKGGVIIVPAGTYSVTQVMVSTKTSWVFMAGAVVKQRAASTVNTALFKFVGGSDGSEMKRFTLDGNRTALASSYPNNGTQWLGIWVSGATNVTVRDGVLQNFATNPILWTSGTVIGGGLLENVVITSCGMALIVQQNLGLTVRGIYASGIGNASLATYQHAFIFQDNTDCTIENLVLYNFSPDGAALEPSPGAFLLFRHRRCSIRNIVADGFVGADPKGGTNAIGFSISAFTDCLISGITTNGYINGQIYNTPIRCSISDLRNDGQYALDANGHSNIGIRVNNTGHVYTVIGTQADDSLLNTQARDTTVTGFISTRSYYGMEVCAESVAFSNGNLSGNSEFGLYLNDGQGYFPGANIISKSLTFSALIARRNGAAGVYATSYDGVTFDGACDFTDNGQSPAVSARMRAGLLLEGSSPGGNITVSSEALPAGNGTQTAFVFTTANPYLNVSTVLIQANGLQINDDGVGNLIDSNNINYGTINYTTGAVSLTFPSAPLASASIGTIAYIAWTLNGAGRLRVAHGARVGDTQNITILKGASFNPTQTVVTVSIGGVTYYQYIIALVKPAGIGVGQYITIRNAGGSGANLTGQVVGYYTDANNELTDDVILQSATSVTLSASGNLIAIPGTATTSSTNPAELVGVSTQWTQILGQAWVTPDGGTTWTQCRRVYGPSTNLISSKNQGGAIFFPIPPTLSGASMSQLLCDIVGIPSQQYGVSGDPNVVGPLYFGDLDYAGCVLAPMDIGGTGIPMTSTAWSPGSRFIVSGTTVLNTAGYSSNLWTSANSLPAMQPGMTITGYSVQFTVGVVAAGTPTASLLVSDESSGTVYNTVVSGQPVAKNAQFAGKSAVAAIPAQSGIGLKIVGATAFPTAGTVAWSFAFEMGSFPWLANVP